MQFNNIFLKLRKWKIIQNTIFVPECKVNYDLKLLTI